MLPLLHTRQFNSTALQPMCYGRRSDGAGCPQAQGRDTAEGSPGLSFRAPDRPCPEGCLPLHSAKLLVSRRPTGARISRLSCCVAMRAWGLCLEALHVPEPRCPGRDMRIIGNSLCSRLTSLRLRPCDIAQLAYVAFRTLTGLAFGMPSVRVWARTR